MLVNGQQAPGLISFTVTNSNFFTCDKWSATIALDGAGQGWGAPQWALQTGIDLQLCAALAPGAALTTIIGGTVDKAELDLDGQRVTLAGRDYSAPLIDTLTNAKYVNQTSSQVAATIAAAHGLATQITATSIPVGRYLDSETAHISDDLSEFRLLSYLAQQEGFDLYTKGRTLVFAPPQTDPNPLILTYSYGPPQLNSKGLRLIHDKVLGQQVVTVQVRSWNYQQKKPIIATWQSQKTTVPPKGQKHATPPTMNFTRSQLQGGAGAKGPFYIERRSGLTQQQADQLAQKLLKDITSNERAVEYEGPAILGVDARRTLRLTGTNTAFDQDYTIGEVERTFGWDAGATMNIHAKASSPQEQITL
jgi:phage protein D